MFKFESCNQRLKDHSFINCHLVDSRTKLKKQDTVKLVLTGASLQAYCDVVSCQFCYAGAYLSECAISNMKPGEYDLKQNPDKFLAAFEARTKNRGRSRSRWWLKNFLNKLWQPPA